MPLAVQAAVADTNQAGIFPKGTCAEPSAADKFLQEARTRPGNEGKSDQELLGQIDQGGIRIRHHDNKLHGKDRVCCPNCKQIMTNLGIPPGDPRYGRG